MTRMIDHAPESAGPLRESRRQLATLLSNLPGMVYRALLDPRWPMEFVSGGSLALTGYEPTAFMRGDPDFASLIDPEDRPVVWDCVSTAVRARQPFTLTYRITTASGQPRWVWEQGRGVFDDSGEVVAVEGFITDITQRRSVEEQLRRTNRLYAVLTRINEAIVRIRHPASLLDEACRIAVEEGRFPMAWVALCEPKQPAVVRVAACSGDTAGILRMALGDGDKTTLDEGHIARANAAGRQQIVSRLDLDPQPEPWKELLLAHGLTSLAAFPLFITDRVVGSFNLYSDRSFPFDGEERRLLESLTADLSFALERAEEESYRRSLQADLARARSIETIGRVSGSLAHDFNNILMVIGACAETLQRNATKRGLCLREVEQIQSACARGGEITRRLLTFGRAPSCQVQRLDLGELLRDTMPLLSRMTGGNIDLEVDIPDGEHPVLSDAAQLEQVLLNMVLNARDAMPEGGVVNLWIDEVEERHPLGLHGSIKGPYVRLVVQDSGHGLSPEVRERLFEPFFTTKPNEAGSGLGLSIAFDVTRRAGGWITPSNTEDGGGARFELYFPRADV